MAPPRKFDHDEARRLRAEGLFYREIAERFGVSTQAVLRACDPRVRARMDMASAERHRRNRKPCKGGCGRLVWMHMTGRNPTGYCIQCLDTSTSVRETTLRCSECGEWKPDAEFGWAGRNKARRFRHAYCKPCQAPTRQAYRERHKIPCVKCGKPRLPANEKHKPGVKDTGLCLACYQETLRGKRPAERKAAA